MFWDTDCPCLPTRFTFTVSNTFLSNSQCAIYLVKHFIIITIYLKKKSRKIIKGALSNAFAMVKIL